MLRAWAVPAAVVRITGTSKAVFQVVAVRTPVASVSEAVRPSESKPTRRAVLERPSMSTVDSATPRRSDRSGATTQYGGRCLAFLSSQISQK
ncbi:MAG: hypothetical protein ACRDV9_05100 [Acidimicrobiia bacterium]